MVNYDLNLIFHALGDFTRRSVLAQICSREMRITDLQTPSKMSLAAVSKHVKVLETSGLIVRRKQGREVFIRVNQDGIKCADEWISTYTQYWNEQLDSLDTYLSGNK